MSNKLNVVVISVFLWAGFVSAISFMEAWLKFRAPGITLPLGLGIGRLVFSALNKMEIVFALSLIANLVFAKQINHFLKKWYFVCPLVILVIHTALLLPALDIRAIDIINGIKVPASNLHIYYIISELIKVTTLIILGISLLNHNTNRRLN